jgi:uncharacterized protein (TIGR01777 family)
MKKRHPGRPLSPLEDPFAAFDEVRRVVIAGGAGFLGHALARTLAQDGREVVILSRRPAPAAGRVRTVVWDGRTVGDWATELEGAEAVVNLTGRSVACLYTPENKREIMDSRINSVRAIAQANARCAEPPPVLVQASSLAIYGDAGDRVCDENAPHGSGFSADVCAAWEDAFFADSKPDGQRYVALRIGFVLGRDGGALVPLAKLARCFLGGAAGSGRQYISWLHLDDFCAMVRWAITNPAARGAYNATAETPATNAEFMRELRGALRRPWSPPTPAWAVKFGARYIMRVDPSLALTGRRCVPRRLISEGFVPKRNDLARVLRELLWVPRG